MEYLKAEILVLRDLFSYKGSNESKQPLFQDGGYIGVILGLNDVNRSALNGLE